MVIEVRERADVHVVTHAVREAAVAAGIGDRGAVEGLVLAAAELASNLVRYAVGGRVTVEVVERAGRRGVQVRGDDEGPGIADLEAALADGTTTAAGSLGGGFGAMRRGADEFRVESSPAGTHVVLTTWARAR